MTTVSSSTYDPNLANNTATITHGREIVTEEGW